MSEETLYASPTERSPPIWKKPPQRKRVKNESTKRLQVITRAQQNPSRQDQIYQNRLKPSSFENTPTKVNLNENNFGTRNSGGGGYDVKVFDARHKQSSYSIKDGFIDTENIYPNRQLSNIRKNDNALFHNQYHSRNGEVVSNGNPTNHTVFRQRHLGNGRSKLHRSPTATSKQFDKNRVHQANLYNQKTDINRRRFGG